MHPARGNRKAVHHPGSGLTPTAAPPEAPTAAPPEARIGIAAAKQAAPEFMAAVPPIQVKVAAADHENFQWELIDRTCAWAFRMKPRLPPAKASGRDVVTMMSTDDDYFDINMIRVDWRTIHPVYVFVVKRPEDVRDFRDVHRLVYTTSADHAFRPIAEGSWPLVNI